MTPEKLKHVAWLAVKAVLRTLRLQVHVNEHECSAIAIEADGPMDPPASVAASAAFLVGDRMRDAYPVGTYETRSQKSDLSLWQFSEILIFRSTGLKAVISFTPISEGPLKGIHAVVEGVVKAEGVK